VPDFVGNTTSSKIQKVNSNFQAKDLHSEGLQGILGKVYFAVRTWEQSGRIMIGNKGTCKLVHGNEGSW
jgi:hypothetical protein